MSKWVVTAMRPVPDKSHILKTCPTKAGPPPPFPADFRPDILTVDGNLELDSDDDEEDMLFLAAAGDGDDSFEEEEVESL